LKKALITGITGQDGAYLADFLLKMGTKFKELKEGPLC
jgi:GDP-D-mannose dehydratase